MRTELVTSLKRKATEIITEINAAHEPVLITQHGLPAAYLIDVESYQAMETRLNLLEGIAKGEKALAEGRTLTHDEAKTKLSRWLK